VPCQCCQRLEFRVLPTTCRLTSSADDAWPCNNRPVPSGTQQGSIGRFPDEMLHLTSMIGCAVRQDESTLRTEKRNKTSVRRTVGPPLPGEVRGGRWGDVTAPPNTGAGLSRCQAANQTIAEFPSGAWSLAVSPTVISCSTRN